MNEPIANMEILSAMDMSPVNASATDCGRLFMRVSIVDTANHAEKLTVQISDEIYVILNGRKSAAM
jgi:hypothetical protein